MAKGWFRRPGYLAGQYRQLRRDKDLEQSHQEIKHPRDQIDDTVGWEPQGHKE